ncbi:MAG: type II toxin-antitoxin system VapC family toxin [Planctomycetales bacterium]|nr:type II toxin-antitoxin system VapC family toxin [Planctomycetales bacterium]
MIVVDANVSLKWFMPEQGMAEAFGVLRSGRKLVAPWVIRDEVVSGLVRRVRREELSTQEARDAIGEWLRELQLQTVHLIDDESLLSEAAELGFELKHPLYDCLYLALAERLEVPFVTADKTFFDRAKTVSNNAHWLYELDMLLAA